MILRGNVGKMTHEYEQRSCQQVGAPLWFSLTLPLNCLAQRKKNQPQQNSRISILNEVSMGEDSVP